MNHTHKNKHRIEGRKILLEREIYKESKKNTNSTFKKLNVPSPYSIEAVKDSCSGKSKQIKQLQTEFIKTIEIANNLYEKLKNFHREIRCRFQTQLTINMCGKEMLESILFCG
ncbi:hypothetical protein C1645_735017 [Glomus cerebriforme]|uniref:Uncharacterized protein n=1 Tax=Glomus cerebriforme TaxID=658196 RepID=A0A397TGJ5_9GLOM|nr:hypothetical protein C1645_735017 [Glomus cerebriforme]